MAPIYLGSIKVTRLRLYVGALLGVFLVGCASFPEHANLDSQWRTIQPGVMYARREPVPDSVVHVVRVDLRLNRLKVSGVAEKGQTLDAMVDTLSAAASANDSIFNRRFEPRGITISDGVAWSPVMSQQQSPLLACDTTEHCQIQIEPPFEVRIEWINVVAGTPWLLKRGMQRTALDDAQCKSLCANPHPRTAVGLDESKRYLYVVTAEGRSPPVMGLSLVQLSSIMAEMGITDAINLDGGGSSALFLNGISVMKRPDHEPHQRQVANAIHILPR